MNLSGKTIRIALVITELEVGGAERCLTQLALRLDPTRFAPKVFVLAPPPRRRDLVAQLERAEIPVEFLNCSSSWQLAGAVSRLRRRLKQFGPHVVQSMLYHANMVSRLALGRRHHAVWCSGVRVADPSRTRQLLERRAFHAADRVVCVSRLVADFVGRDLLVPPEKIVVVPNGVDVEACMRRPAADLTALGVKDPQRAITCVARLAEQKGIDLLLAAAPRILSELPTHDLLLVGDGPLQTKLRQLARQTGFGDRIHFCGWQSDVVGILRASDLLVLPSRWEGMPNVLLEAMACERPVVCTNVEGVVEALGPLSQAQTVSAGNPQLIAEKVVAVLSATSLPHELGVANRQRVAENFAMETMLHRYEDLYLQLSQSRI